MNINDQIDTREDPFNIGINLPEGHLTWEDEEVLKKYAIGTDLTVEIGTFKGRSASILSLFSKRVVTIDLYHPEQDHGGFENNKKVLHDFSPSIEVIKNNSYREARNFKNNSIDILFIDAGHASFWVYRDFYCYFDRVKNGGIIIFHDYPHCDFVKIAVDNIVQFEEELRMVEQKGWCMVTRKIKAEGIE